MAATTSEAFKKGLARKQGRKTLVFMAKSRELTSSDIMRLTLEGEGETNLVSSGQAKQMLQGRNPMELGDRAKRDVLGGTFFFDCRFD